MAPVIDVHTHMLTRDYVDLLEQHGGPAYTLKAVTGGLRAIHLHDAPFMTPVPEMFDWDLRIKNMDRTGIDVAVVSLSVRMKYVDAKADRPATDEFRSERQAAVR